MMLLRAQNAAEVCMCNIVQHDYCAAHVQFTQSFGMAVVQAIKTTSCTVIVVISYLFVLRKQGSS